MPNYRFQGQNRPLETSELPEMLGQELNRSQRS